MAADWTYTVFDQWWRPSDELEDRLSVLEAEAAQIFDELAVGVVPPTQWQQIKLCDAIYLAACRSPEVMSRGLRRARDLASAYSKVHDFPDRLSFERYLLMVFGVPVSEADFKALRGRQKDELMSFATSVAAMSPQDPNLPEQMALEAVFYVGQVLGRMNLELLDAPSGKFFVLGDTPLPDTNLGQGFVIPLGHSLAALYRPIDMTEQLPRRRNASPAELEESNTWQFENCLRLVIGPNQIDLDALGSAV